MATFRNTLWLERETRTGGLGSFLEADGMLDANPNLCTFHSLVSPSCGGPVLSFLPLKKNRLFQTPRGWAIARSSFQPIIRDRPLARRSNHESSFDPTKKERGKIVCDDINNFTSFYQSITVHQVKGHPWSFVTKLNERATISNPAMIFILKEEEPFFMSLSSFPFLFPHFYFPHSIPVTLTMSIQTSQLSGGLLDPAYYQQQQQSFQVSPQHIQRLRHLQQQAAFHQQNGLSSPPEQEQSNLRSKRKKAVLLGLLNFLFTVL